MKFKKFFILTLIMGLVYLDMELFMRAFRGDLLKTGFHGVKYLSFAGWSSLWMMFIGGFSGFFIGVLNEDVKNKRIKLKLWFQCLIGTIIIFLIEFITGYICNIKLGLNIWTYSDFPLNILGQITLVYTPLWFLITPFVIWMDDILRFFIFNEEKPKTLVSYYKSLFKGE